MTPLDSNSLVPSATYEPDFFEKRIQPFTRRFLTTGKGRQVYVWTFLRLATLAAWPFYALKAAVGGFNGARINLGSGASRLQDWVGTDANPMRKPKVWMDVRNRWPFRSGSIAGVATSHMLEHLYDDELAFVLKEVGRVLRPGGFLHVSVPSLEKAVAEYVKAENNDDRGEKFHLTCHWFGAHHQVFDAPRLRRKLLEAGFEQITEPEFPQSRFCSEEEVRAIDLHPDESIFVECMKPRSAE